MKFKRSNKQLNYIKKLKERLPAGTKIRCYNPTAYFSNKIDIEIKCKCVHFDSIKRIINEKYTIQSGGLIDYIFDYKKGEYLKYGKPTYRHFDNESGISITLYTDSKDSAVVENTAIIFKN